MAQVLVVGDEPCGYRYRGLQAPGGSGGAQSGPGCLSWRAREVTSPKGWRHPQGTDLGVYSSDDLDWVAQELNDRPRKRLAFKKPIELIGDLLLR